MPTQDHEGHGQSSGLPGFFSSADAMAGDVVALLRETSARYPGLPLFLFGISFGGCLALLAALKLAPEVCSLRP